MSVQAVRVEPRAVVLPRSHPLSDRPELGVADVLDETFVSYHPNVQPAWAGFHSLDDHRGEPPRAVTVDRALTSLEMLGIMSTREAITVVPISDAKIVESVVSHVVAIPLRDAHPAVLSLVWNEESRHPLVAILVAVGEAHALDDLDSRAEAAC